MMTASYSRNRLRDRGQGETLFSLQQILNEQTTGSAVDPSSGGDQFLSDGAHQMCLAAARVVKGKDVLAPVKRRSFQQGVELTNNPLGSRDDPIHHLTGPWPRWNEFIALEYHE